MSVIDEVRSERQVLAHALKHHPGLRKIVVEELYPESAHFIYELLQNAEDARDAAGHGASVASFTLGDQGLVFEHDGRPFDKDDIRAITNIGEGTKAEDEGKIGKFGIGFKSVFAYTETPHIWSPTYSFKIEELVLPHELDATVKLDGKTRFEFPFDNPKKPASIAFTEIRDGLNGLDEITLMFLSHLESVRWRVGDKVSGELLRHRHSDHHYEVLKLSGSKMTSRHFLKFDQPVRELETQRVAVAFALELSASGTSFDPARPLASQFRIVAAEPAHVAVFFPADRETSGLRFHLHAPFATELSRASIKDVDANLPLFRQCAELAASALHEIRNLGLLTGEFLNVLPNGQDRLPARYVCVRSAIVEAMNREPLTPTYDREHAPAKRLLQSKPALKEILNANDLETLIGDRSQATRWVMAASQRNSNADRFLAQLRIETWDVADFVNLVMEKAAPKYIWMKWTKNETDPRFLAWLVAKPAKWHQGFYAMLYRELQTDGTLRRLKTARIVRLADGNYGSGESCYFPGHSLETDEVLPRVDAAVYSSGRGGQQREQARGFLEAIGVRAVGEAEQIEAILKTRYRAEARTVDDKTCRSDLRRFFALVEESPSTAAMFGEFRIFEDDEKRWRVPRDLYLDSPYLDTGLTAYYDSFGNEAECCALSGRYARMGLSKKRFVAFARAVGLRSRLEIRECTVSEHRDRDQLMEDVARYGARESHLRISQDWNIPRLDDVLAAPSIEKAKLIWDTMRNAWIGCLAARYRPNKKYEPKIAPSSLCYLLVFANWVPQEGGVFVTPARASRDLLPEGFAFDSSWPWLKTLRFGVDEVTRVGNERLLRGLANSLGFDGKEGLQRARRFASLSPDQQERILTDCERTAPLPSRDPANKERRRERVSEGAQNAAERITEERRRSVVIDRDGVKEEAGEYLRDQYTNDDGDVICQICKKAMPFKLDDGSDYFERVEFIRNLKRRHHQNYLALCPTHSAMFLYANGSRDSLMLDFSAMSGRELPVTLARAEVTIYFTGTHIADLRVVIESERDANDTHVAPEMPT